MFLSKLFKHTRAKVMMALAGLTMVFGAAATISTVAAAQQNDVVETKARSTSDYVYLTWNGSIPGNYDVDWDTAGSNTCYAYFYYSSNTSVNNGWPGKAMSKVSDDLYRIALGNASYDRVIFNRTNGEGDPWSRSTNDGKDAIHVGSDLSKNNCFFFTKWGQDSYSNCGSWSRIPGYYLRGVGVNGSTAWDDSQMVAADASTVFGNVASWSGVSISASAEYKIVEYTKAKGYNWPNKSFSGNHIHHSGGGESNITCDTAGSYKVFYTNTNSFAINQDVTISLKEYKGSETSKGDITGNTDILLTNTDGFTFGSYTGYNISSYKIGSSSGTTINPASYYPTGDVTVYAIYEAQNYTVRKGETNGTLSVNSSGKFGQSLAISWTPSSAEGYTYTFNYVKIYGGTNSSGALLKTVNSGTSTTFTMSSTYYADIYIQLNYTKAAKTYTVTLDQQSGSGGSTSVTATYGSAMPSAAMPTRTGYGFQGYYDGENGTGTKYYNANGSSARTWNKASTAILYAYWIADVYTVTFSAQFYQGSTNRGNANLAPGSATYGVTFTPPTPAADTNYPIVYRYSGIDYTFQGWYTDSACTTPFVSKSNHTSGFTVYAKYTDQNTYSLTYYTVADGVTQNGNTVVSAVACGTTVAAAGGTPTLYGYSFDGWYQEAACSTSYGSHEITGTTTAYAKFTRLSTNTTYYADISTCSTYINGTIYVHYFKKSGDDVIASTTWPGIKTSSISGISNVYAFSIPADATGFIINNNDGSSRAQSQTIDIAPSADHNLYSITTNNPSSNQEGEWLDIVYQLGGYFNATSYEESGWGDWTYVKMSAPTDASGNQAELNGVACSAFAQIKVRLLIGQSEGDPKQMWYGHVGKDNYAFLDYTSGRTNSSITKADVNDGYSNAFFKTESTYSFYLHDGLIYIEDDANKEDAGYLYFANAASTEDITVTAQNSNGATVESAVRLSRITGVKSAGNLKFNGIAGLHRIPLYNLRGSDTSYYITSLTLSAGGSSRTYTWAAATTGSPEIYIDLSSSTQDASTKGPAAAVAMDIALAISNATNSSVCNIDKDTAEDLCDAYDVSAVATLLESSSSDYYVTTWASKKPTYSGSQNAGFHSIRVELGNIAGGNYVIATASFIPGGPKGNESPLTLTLWIVLGCGLLGLGAIGTAYFVSKKKKHQA